MATVHALPHVAQKTAEATQALHDDIQTRWSRLGDREIGYLENTEDLVARVCDLYGLAKSKARSDVAAVLRGRTL